MTELPQNNSGGCSVDHWQYVEKNTVENLLTHMYFTLNWLYFGLYIIISCLEGIQHIFLHFIKGALFGSQFHLSLGLLCLHVTSSDWLPITSIRLEQQMDGASLWLRWSYLGYPLSLASYRSKSIEDRLKLSVQVNYSVVKDHNILTIPEIFMYQVL